MEPFIPRWLLDDLEVRAKRCQDEANPGDVRELAALALEVVARTRPLGDPYREAAPASQGPSDPELALIASLEREIAELRARVVELEARSRPG